MVGVGVADETGSVMDLGSASVDVPSSALGAEGRVVQSTLYCVRLRDGDDEHLESCELRVEVTDGSGNVVPVDGLAEPIQLTFDGTGACLTWNGTAWTHSQNVTTIHREGATICETTHLSSFGTGPPCPPPFKPKDVPPDWLELCATADPTAQPTAQPTTADPTAQPTAEPTVVNPPLPQILECFGRTDITDFCGPGGADTRDRVDAADEVASRRRRGR